MIDLEQLRKDMEAGTPHMGGWAWFGGRDNVYLATKNGGRRFVMDFVRKGMTSAQPRFQVDYFMKNAVDELTTYSVGDGVARGQKQADADPSVYRMDVSGIDHPDASRIARLPDLERAYLELREAADALADAASGAIHNSHDVTDDMAEDVDKALAAYRKATQ